MSDPSPYFRRLLYALIAVFPFSAKSQLDKELFAAIKNCDAEAVQQRLNSPVNINAVDSNGANALMWAVYYCDLSLVKQLVQRGAKVADTGVIYEDVRKETYYTSLQGIAAAREGKLPVLKYLADSLHLPVDERSYNPETRKKDSWTPLSAAASSGQLDVVHYLLGKGVDVNTVNPDGSAPLIMAAKLENWALFELLVKGGARKKLGAEAGALIRTAAQLSARGPVNGDWHKDLALQQFIRQLNRIYFGESHFAYALSLNYEAYLYHLMGRYEQALPLYEQAIAVAKGSLGEKHHVYAGMIHNMAYLYKEMGLPEKALPLLEKAKDLARDAWGEEHAGYAISLHSLGSLYKDMGRYEKVLPLFEQAKAIRKKVLGHEHTDYALSLRELADVYHLMGWKDKAMPLYEQAIAIRKKVLGEEHPFYALTLYHQALLYQDMGRYEKAQPLYEQALAIRKKALGEEHPDYSQSLCGLALLHQEMKQYEKALPLFTEASASSLNHLYRTYTTLSEREKMGFLAKKSLQFSHLPALLYTGGLRPPAALQQVYANELALKGMVLEDQKAVLNGIRKSGDTAVLQVYERWCSNKEVLGKQMLLPVKQRAADLDSLEEATNQLEQQLSRSNATFRSRQQRLTPKDIAQRLKKAEVAIEFTSFRVYGKKPAAGTWYAALVLLPVDSTVHFLPLFEESQLRRLLQRAGDAGGYTAVDRLYGRRKHAAGSVSDSLYQLVWKPLESLLQGVQTVYYAPAGLLHRVAFQALPLDSGGLLLDKYRLHQLLSTRYLVQPAEVTPRQLSAQIWGGITYSVPSGPARNSTASRGRATRGRAAFSAFDLYTWDTRSARGAGPGWKPLPGTKKEMDSLNRLLSGAGIIPTCLGGSKATEESFKAISGRSPRVLHLATHGFFLPVKDSRPGGDEGGRAFTVQQNPLFRSGLVLAGGNEAWSGKLPAGRQEDGILTAYEIAQMDLAGTELVVLSACETAMGDIRGNEGIIGLQRAFKMAGVKQLLVSQWQVPDQATMELMTLFYKNWLGGLPTREALRQAQLQLKETYKHPYFWAGFVVVE